MPYWPAVVDQYVDLQQAMTGASNLLLALTFLHWVNYAWLNSPLNESASTAKLTQLPANPSPLFHEWPSWHFDDIYDGSIERLSYRLNRTEAAVVLFYAPWSRASLHFRPIFEQLAIKHAQTNFAFLAINCWQPGQGTCRQAFSLRGGYPYVSYFTHQTGHVFHNGVLSESEVLLFIYRFTFPFLQAADLKTLTGLRLLASSSIIVIVPHNSSQASSPLEKSDQFFFSPRNFVSQSLFNKKKQESSNDRSIVIDRELFRIGIRSLMTGSVAVLVPQQLFPTTRPGLAYFYMPSLAVMAVPMNWTGWLPPIRPAKLPRNTTTTSKLESASEYPLVDRGVDRAVVVVVNSFATTTGPQLCNPGVAVLRAASWLHSACVKPPNRTHEDILSEATIGLAIEEQQCKLLRKLSRDHSHFRPVSFRMLSDGGEEMAQLSEVIGLGCDRSKNGFIEEDEETTIDDETRHFNRFEALKTSFVVVEHHAGAGTVFNQSKHASWTSLNGPHLGPRRPLDVAPGLYLLDGRQEAPARFVNVTRSQEDAVEQLVDWLLERQKKPDENLQKLLLKLPLWLPETRVPTLVYYEAPWCVFCSVLTPRIRLAVRSLERALVHFRFVRVSDSEQTMLSNRQNTNDNSMFSVPHYPSLVLYPFGTKQAYAVVVAHSPGNRIVPGVLEHLPVGDRLLACLLSASRQQSKSNCLMKQLADINRLQHLLWSRIEDLFLIEDLMTSGTFCSPKRLQLLRFLGRLRSKLSRPVNTWPWWRVLGDLARFEVLQSHTAKLSMCSS